MCWSYDATLGFCVFETVILAYIWKRNVVNDKINVIGHIPILVQEMLQLWMWTEMNPSEDTQLTCSDQNRWVSFLIAVVVHTAPMFMLLRGYLGALQAKSTEELLRVLKRALKVISGVCVTATIVTGVMMWAGTWVSCTVKGPFGHQIWAMLMVPDPTLSFQEWLYPGWIEALPVGQLCHATPFLPRICSRALVGCFAPFSDSKGGGGGGEATHQQPPGAVACCPLCFC